MRAVTGVLVVSLLAAGCAGHARRLDLRRVVVSPTPTARMLVVSGAKGREALAGVAPLVPTPLPPNPRQDCRLGTSIAVTVGRRTVTYGPCTWPRSIERVRRAVLRNAPVPSPREPVVRGWRAVLLDWYDGRMDHVHPCRAVREAIRHLPVDGMTYSTVGLDLRAYARGVC